MWQVYSIYTHLLHMCQGYLYPPATHASGLSIPLCYTCVRASYTHLLHMCHGYLYPLLHMCQGYLYPPATHVSGVSIPPFGPRDAEFMCPLPAIGTGINFIRTITCNSCPTTTTTVRGVDVQRRQCKGGRNCHMTFYSLFHSSTPAPGPLINRRKHFRI